MATLVDNVYVGNRFYGPDHGGDADVTPEIAAQITDPKAWGGVLPRFPESSTIVVDSMPATQSTVVIDPMGDMTPAELDRAMADEVTRRSTPEPVATEAFAWLEDPDAQAAVELLEEQAVSGNGDIGPDSGSMPRNDDSAEATS